MALGYFFGRTQGGDPGVQKTLDLAFELQQGFKDNHQHLCCEILTRGMNMEAGEHKRQCISFTGEIAEKVACIVVRELGLINKDVKRMVQNDRPV